MQKVLKRDPRLNRTTKRPTSGFGGYANWSLFRNILNLYFYRKLSKSLLSFKKDRVDLFKVSYIISTSTGQHEPF